MHLVSLPLQIKSSPMSFLEQLVGVLGEGADSLLMVASPGEVANFSGGGILKNFASFFFLEKGAAKK